MPVKERRTTHFEWSCDGPLCPVIERVFERNARPDGWLTMKVTRDTTKAFHTRGCAQAYFQDSLDDGLDRADESTTVTSGVLTIDGTGDPMDVRYQGETP